MSFNFNSVNFILFFFALNRTLSYTAFIIYNVISF